ncbi:MAG: hypothetical protein D3910_18410, partial [Candidatus Electrothrix sp. ATG2]|nr:hypothetical protein [Candidatus Electrothrix sp. ATG2]
GLWLHSLFRVCLLPGIGVLGVFPELIMYNLFGVWSCMGCNLHVRERGRGKERNEIKKPTPKGSVLVQPEGKDWISCAAKEIEQGR